jgi:hypothetical protein
MQTIRTGCWEQQQQQQQTPANIPLEVSDADAGLAAAKRRQVVNLPIQDPKTPKKKKNSLFLITRV